MMPLIAMSSNISIVLLLFPVLSVALTTTAAAYTTLEKGNDPTMMRQLSLRPQKKTDLVSRLRQEYAHRRVMSYNDNGIVVRSPQDYHRHLPAKQTVLVTIALDVSYATRRPNDGDFETYLCHLDNIWTYYLSESLQRDVMFEARYAQWTYDDTAQTAIITLEASASEIEPFGTGVDKMNVDALLSQMTTDITESILTDAMQYSSNDDDFLQPAVISSYTAKLKTATSSGSTYFSTANCGVAQITFSYGFFDDIALEAIAPTETEVHNMLCQTDEYYTTFLTQIENLGSGGGDIYEVELTFNKVSWTVDTTSDLPFVVVMNVKAVESPGYRHISPADVLDYIQTSDFSKYVEKSVWASLPVDENVFHDVNRVTFSGTVKYDNKEEEEIGSFSTDHCVDGQVVAQLNSTDSEDNAAGEEESIEEEEDNIPLVTMDFEFGFYAGEERSPNNDEMQALVCQTANYYADKWDKEDLIQEFEFQVTNWEFDPSNTATPLSVSLQVRARNAIGKSVDPEDAVSEMTVKNVEDFITGYGWETTPVGEDNLFYHTSQVLYLATIRENENNGTVAFSSMNCPIFSDDPDGENSIHPDNVSDDKDDKELATLQLEFGFMDGQARAPSNDEMQAMLCETANYYADEWNEATALIDDFELLVTDWSYSDDTSDSLPLTMTLQTNASDGNGNRVDPGDVLNALTKIDIKAYIALYVWQTAPVEESNVFYHTGQVNYRGAVREIDNDDEEGEGQTVLSSKSCTRFANETDWDEVEELTIVVSFIISGPAGAPLNESEIGTAFEMFVDGMPQEVARGRLLQGNIDTRSLLEEVVETKTAKLASVAPTECPATLQSNEDDIDCYVASASYQVLVVDDANPDDVTNSYTTATQVAIESGMLEQYLETVNPESPVVISADPMATTKFTDTETKKFDNCGSLGPICEEIGPGATIGTYVFLAVCLILNCTAGIYYCMREEKSTFTPQDGSNEREGDCGNVFHDKSEQFDDILIGKEVLTADGNAEGNEALQGNAQGGSNEGGIETEHRATDESQDQRPKARVSFV